MTQADHIFDMLRTRNFEITFDPRNPRSLQFRQPKSMYTYIIEFDPPSFQHTRLRTFYYATMKEDAEIDIFEFAQNISKIP